MNHKAYGILILVSLLATVGGILTLIPAAGATYENLFGYRSLCTFAPAATFFCFGIAGTSCVLRASLVKRKAMAGRAVVKAAPVVVVAAIFAIAIGFTGWFLSVKSQYTDGASGASVSRSIE
jgi:hypothetical protein